MELTLLKSLMNKDFYQNYQNKHLNSLFTNNVKKIKITLDKAMSKYNQSITTKELEGLFFSNNPTITTSNKEVFQNLFDKLRKEQLMTPAVTKDVLSNLFRQSLGEQISNLGFDYLNGTVETLEPLRNLIETHNDDFMPSMNVEWEDISLDTIAKLNSLETQWKFNIPSLSKRIEGINKGHLIIIGARPNMGKTSFHASLIASSGGFAHQGAKCLILTNEEAYYRVVQRYISAANAVKWETIEKDTDSYKEKYNVVKANINFKDSTGNDLGWVEQVVKSEKPDIVVLDMGDKFATKTSDKSDVYLKDAAIHARNIGKQYGCAIIWMSQLSAEAEGRSYSLNQSMLEGSKTGKAAEADLMILIGKKEAATEDDEQSPIRYLIIAKNKLKGGWHGNITVNLDGETSRYTA